MSSIRSLIVLLLIPAAALAQEGVTVDQEGRVSLRGSDQVAVLIDGRPSSLTGFGSQRGLDNVTAANIEAIEIIYNPSASFDAAGMAITGARAQRRKLWQPRSGTFSPA